MTTVQSTNGPRRTLRERILGNPVAIKELRGRMRGARAFIVLTVYLGLMSAFVGLIYLLYTSSAGISGPSQSGEIGRVLFIAIAGVELFLVTFIAPAFAAGAISGERERQTYDLLRTTLLPSRTMIVGKIFATLSYVFLLLLAAIPLQSVAFLFGGVTEVEVILSFVVLLGTSVLLGTMGVFFSALTRRTLSANVLSYGFAMFSILLLPIGGVMFGPAIGQLLSRLGMQASPTIEALFIYIIGLIVATNPMATLLGTLYLLIDRQEAFYFEITLQNGQQLPLVSPWIVFLIFCLIASVILAILATRRIERIEET